MLSPQNFPETRPSLLCSLAEAGAGQSPWREFFERYAPAIFRVARLRGLAEADADDVVQTVMLDIARHIGGFEYDRDRGRFRQWVRRIAESKICSVFRRHAAEHRRRANLEEITEAPPTLDALWEEQWQLQDLKWCLDQVALDVSPRRMQAFRLYALEGHSAEDTAAAMSMTPGHVYVVRSQMLRLLRERMKELENGRQ